MEQRFSILLALVIAPLCTHAQWLSRPDPNTPRTKDGKPNLSAPAPRLRGKPDLSGIWEAESSPRKELASAWACFQGAKTAWERLTRPSIS
jgi:hypothetical protein